MLAYELRKRGSDATNPGDVAGYLVERKETSTDFPCASCKTADYKYFGCSCRALSLRARKKSQNETNERVLRFVQDAAPTAGSSPRAWARSFPRSRSANL